MNVNENDHPMKLVSIEQFCKEYCPGVTPAGVRPVIARNDPTHPVSRNHYRVGRRHLIDILGYMRDLRAQKQGRSDEQS